MSNQISWFIVIGMTVHCLAAPVRAEIKVQPDKDNVVGSKLVGMWEADEELTKRLGGRAAGTIAFASDASVAAKIPEKFEAFLKDKPVYLAGTMKAAGNDAPFILIEHKGNPHVVFYLPKDDDAFGNPESINVMLAIAKDTTNDLLFVGGDFNNQPFAAYRRVKADAKP